MMRASLSAICFFMLCHSASAVASPRVKPGTYAAVCVEFHGDSDAYVWPVILSDSIAGTRACRAAMSRKDHAVEPDRPHIISPAKVSELEIDLARLVDGCTSAHAIAPTLLVSFVSDGPQKTVALDRNGATILLRSFMKHWAQGRVHVDLRTLYEACRR